MPNAFTIFTTSMSDIIFLNGTSSSGKSTIARALREKLPSFSYFASDQLAEAGFRPLTRTLKNGSDSLLASIIPLQLLPMRKPTHR